MTTRRRFTGEFKARVVMEALRGDKTVQEIAARRQVHPNRVSTWKRQEMDGLSEVFLNGADYEHQDREAEVRDLHAKIGQLTVVVDFLSRGLKDAGIAVTMEGRQRCMDNIFIERLWRSLKYEAIYLHE